MLKAIAVVFMLGVMLLRNTQRAGAQVLPAFSNSQPQPVFYVVGAVREAGAFSIHGHEHPSIRLLLSLAGGLTMPSVKSILLVHRDVRNQVVQRYVAAADWGKVFLQYGDTLVCVPATQLKHN